MRIYDVSVTLREGMVVYPGDPAFAHRFVERISEGASCNLSAISLGCHTGTHVDAPLHMIDGAGSMDKIPPQALVGPAEVIAVPGADAVRTDHLEPYDWQRIQRVLLKTDNADKLETGDRFDEGFVYVSGEAAEFLAARDVKLVGVDYLSIDGRGAGHRAHLALLEAGIVIIEGLNLSGVGPGRYEMVCAPMKIAGAEGAPARVFLMDRWGG